MSTKGIIYCRVSSHDQVMGTSLDNQKQACLAYAEAKNIEVRKIFVERGESATAANRTEFLKALDFCKKNKDTEAFIVWKIDRFARNTTDHFAVRAKLVQYGTMLHSVTEHINDDPQGKLMETLLAGFAEFENDMRKQRCTAGMQSKLRSGIWCWSPPIGYVNSMNLKDRRKTLPDQPDQERFYLIQKAFRLYAKGNHSITEVAKLMNTWGFKTRTGKPMRKQLLETILTNKFYAGMIVDPWSGDEYQGQHERMITLSEYCQVQLIKQGFSNNAVRPRLNINPDFPLRSSVFCECGEHLTASWSSGRNKKYPYYRCKNHQCKHYSHGIAKGILEDQFCAVLDQVQPKTKYLKLLEEVVLKRLDNQYVALTQESQHYGSQLKTLKDRQSRLTRMRLDGEIEKAEYISMKQSLENEVTALTISKNEAEIDRLDVETALTYFKKFIGNIAKHWRGMNVKQQQRLQKLVLPKGITYNKTAGAYGTAVLSPIFRLNDQFADGQSDVVAGPGIEPGSGGYEPPEVPLLYPAIRL
jgi:site-specific DNA recombinase